MPSARPWRPRFAAGLVAASSIVALSWSAPCWAEAAPPLRDLVAQAQASAPRIAEAEAAVRRAEGLARQAGARPNPEVSLSAENFAGQSPFRGFEAAEISAEVAQTLETGGKRTARLSAGNADIEAAQARLVQARADLGYALAIAYAEAEAAERRVALADESLALAREDLRVATALVDAGKEAEVRSLQAQAVVTTAQADLDAARVEASGALSQLTVLAGSAAPFTSLAQRLLDLPPRSSGPALDPFATPAVIAAQADREAAARRVRVEQTRGKPDVTVSLGVRRFQGDDATAVLAGVSVPLQVFDRNRGAISAASADLAGAEARLNGARIEAEADVRVSGGLITSADTRLAAARAAERATDEAYRLTRLGYEGGKLPLSELTAARRTLADARIRTLDAQLARARAEAALARLQGRIPFGD